MAVFENEVPVDVLFCDIRLPGQMNGVALAHAAKKIDSGVEVLMTSGYPQGVYLKLMGFNDDMDFIPKPYPVSVLREKLDTLNSHHKRFP
jgi:two-component SAPR family response regulator